ncbi:FtsX-like permease family protein [Pseudoduganella flava]|uniref:FtsX-like permease family protein n=1 Tax=Pseudoduganella flava TaxID=871742 RepID=A0A562PNF9_9BURK|nr:FtsX-like permease family protein [Pseudoduganella flava]QGZ40513.1 FtsX-like permease family protein [Pseudoduganella flava]TWI45957.1 FtsX-like permease family protein [Pseudoduganella flava]
MKLADFRMGWRMLLREPGFSIVTVLGLAGACAAAFLLLGYVRYCFDYDSHVPDAARVALVKQRINWFPRPEWDVRALLPLAGVARESGMVEHAAGVAPVRQPLRVGTALNDIDLWAVDPAFAQVFGIVPVAGDLMAALTRPEGLAVTRDAARRLFGTDAGILHRTVHVGSEPLQVLAVLPDVPANSTTRWEALTGPLSRARPAAERTVAPDWKRGAVYLKLKPSADAGMLEALLQQAVDASPFEQRFRARAIGRTMQGAGTEVKLLALPDAYFDPDLAASRAGGRYGKLSVVLGLAGVAVLILALAVTNHVNLATVRAQQRQRESGLRKLLGASAPRVAAQFWAESTLVALLAAVLGLMLAWLLLPTFAMLVDRELEGMFSPAAVGCALVGALVVGALAGTWPALVAVRVRPAAALAGRDNSETRGGLWLRRGLTVLQSATAIALGALTIAVGWQTWFASHADPGFDPSRLVTVDLPDGVPPPAAQAFADAVRALPLAGGVALSGEAIGRDGNKIVQGFTTRDGRDLRLEIKIVAPEFFAVYGIRPLFGRLFGTAVDQPGGDALVLNTAAATALGYAAPQDAVGRAPFAGEGTVVGIAPDVRHQSLRQAPGPIVYVLRKGYSVLTLRTGAGMEDVEHALAPLWQRWFPDRIMAMQPAASLFAANYGDDERLVKILAAGSMLALGLAAFGIYVLAAYSVHRHRRQIVLRKLHGASRAAIARLLAREFAGLLAAGALIGLPVAWLAIERYLAGFAERAPLGQWPLVLATALAATVALLATTRHGVAALRLPPIAALRD